MLVMSKNNEINHSKELLNLNKAKAKLMFFAIIEYKRFLQSKTCPTP